MNIFSKRKRPFPVLLLCLGLFTVGGEMAPVSAQTGPGGVGTGDGTSSLVLWLRSDEGISTDATGVDMWADQSGYSNAATRRDGSPSLSAGAFNGNPAVSFDASNPDVFNFSGGNPSSQLANLGTGENTILVVSKREGETENLFTLNVDNSNVDFCIFGSCFGTLDLRSIGYNARLGVEGESGTLKLAAISGPNDAREAYSQSAATSNINIISSMLSTGATTRQDLVVNNELEESTDRAEVLRASANEVLLGALGSNTQELLGDSGSDNGYFSGEVAEVIAFNEALNAAQLRIVYNYLSEKYDIQIVDDFYTHAGYNSDVSGLGQAASSLGEASVGTHTSANSAELQMSTSAGDLSAGDYLLFGHDGASSSFSQFERPNGGDLVQKIRREWRVDLTGASSQSVTVSINASDLPTQPSGHNDYAVFVDDDGDFSEGATFYDLENTSGSQYEAPNVTVNDGDYVTIASIQRTLTFAESGETDFENTPDDVPSLPLVLNYPNQSVLPLAFSVSQGKNGPTNGSDYSTCCEPSQSSTFTFPAGQTSFDLNTAQSGPPPFQIADDGNSEPSTEFVDVAVDPNSNSSIAAGDVTTFEFGIVDDDHSRTASLSASPASLSEDSGSNFAVDVTLSSPASGGNVEVSYELAGAATAGEDYENLEAGSPDATQGTVTIPDGQSSTSFDLKVLDDNTYETDEAIDVTLVSIEGGATLAEDAGDLPSETLTITDQDSKPVLSFDSESYSGTEGSPVHATIQLSEPIGAPVSVEFGVSSGTAGSGDYSQVTSSPVQIPAAQTKAQITFDLSAGDGQETTETLTVTLNSTQNGNASLVSPTSAEINIVDADGIQAQGPGGVGDPQSLKAWLAADALSLGDGNEVTTWPDLSGNGNDASVSSGSGPDYQSDGGAAFRNQPVVQFTRSNSDYLELSGLSDLGNSSNTLFVVSSTGETSQQGLVTVADVDPLSDNVVNRRALRYVSGPSVETENGGATVDTNTVSTGAPAILGSVFDGSEVDVATDLEVAQPINDVGTGTGTSALLGAEIELSGGVESQTNHLEGQVAEVIAYNQDLNDAQRIIVANYLAAKYDIPLSNNDFYAGDEGPGYVQEVFGVGQTNGGDAHLRAEGGGAKATVRSDLDDDEFLFVGAPSSQNQNVNVQDAETSGGVGLTARANEDRYVDLSGNFKVDLQFDLDEFGLQGPAGEAAHYKLLRTNSSGNWAVVSATPAVSGDQITFTNVGFPTDYDGRLTIGTTNQASSPLDTRLTAVRGTPGADGSDKGWRFYGPPKTGPVQMQEIGLRTPNGKRQSVSFEANMSYTWENGTWSAASNTTPVPAGRGAIIYLYDDSYIPLDPELLIEPPADGNNGSYDYTGDVNVTVGDGSPTGDASLPVDDTYHLLANPYEVTYDLGALQLHGTDADNDGTDDWVSAVQVWDATEDTDGGDPRGTYKLRSTDPAKPQSDRLISPGQAFWVERNDLGAGGGEAQTVTFEADGRAESSVADYVGTLKSKTSDRAAQIKLRLRVQEASTGSLLARDHATALYLRSGARAEWDAFDAKKMTPLDGAYATLAFEGTGPDGESVSKAQESRPYAVEEPIELPLALTAQGVSGEATITAPDWWSVPSGWTLTLVDTKGTSDPSDDVEHELGRGERAPYTFTVADSEAKRGGEKAAQSSENDPGGEPPSPRAPDLQRQSASSSTSKESAQEARFSIRVDPTGDPLPVEWSDLTVQEEGESVVLQWKTASERNNAGFYVEHQQMAPSDSTPSTNPEDWSRRGFVEGSGTTETPQEYKHRLGELDYGQHAFRLRQVDTEGEATYSDVIETQVRLDKSHEIGAPYPNPVRQQATLEVTVRESQPLQIDMYDILGRRVRRLQREEVSGQQTHRLQVGTRRLSSGVYFLRIQGESFSEVRRFTVVH